MHSGEIITANALKKLFLGRDQRDISLTRFFDTIIKERIQGSAELPASVTDTKKNQTNFRELFFIFGLTIFANQKKMKLIKQNLKLIFSVATFFVLVNALNFLNAADNISFYWKLAGAVTVVLFIASLKTEDGIETNSTDNISISK